mgnify:CR=1 FL=1
MLRLVTPSVDDRDAFLRMARDWRAQEGGDRYELALDDFDAYGLTHDEPSNSPASRQRFALC